MKLSQASFLAACVPAISARFVEINEVDHVDLNPDQPYLIELSPGETAWVTEEEKWELRRVSFYPIPPFIIINCPVMLIIFPRRTDASSWTSPTPRTSEPAMSLPPAP